MIQISILKVLLKLKIARFYIVKNKYYSIKKIIAPVIALAIIIVLACGTNAIAVGSKNTPPVKRYENDNGFSVSSSDSVSKPTYGNSIGALFIDGASSHETTADGTTAYAADGNVSVGYTYTDGDYQTDVKENWNLVSSDAKTIGDIKLSKKVAKGTLIIQKSVDGKAWQNAREPIYNLFSDKKLDRNSIYSIEEADIKSGMYYRVIVCYEMKKKTGTEKGWFGVSNDVFQNRFFTEEYDFYISYANNPVKVLDIKSRQVVSNNATVNDGFTIDDNDANASITVKKDNGSPNSVKAFDSFYAPGTYTINVTSPMGDSFQNTVKVSEGLSTTSVQGIRYKNKEKDGYSTNSSITGAGASEQLTSLLIGQKAGTTIKTAKVNGFNAYGITGDSVNLFIRVADSNEYAQKGYEIVPDEWGKKEKQTIGDVSTGTIASGALIVQKSTDGKNWAQIDNGRYANGLFTTDFYSNYSGNGDILIYSPDGKEVIKGVYIRVLYAYEMKKTDSKDKYRCVEEYSFYLCNDELGAVTFHNLSAKEQLESVLGEEDEITVKMYETAETMNSGAVTAKGFSIDTSLNPTVKYSVKKDGKAVTGTKFTETGKYDITLTSAVGSTKSITLYVDCMTDDQTLKLYFGDGFIEGKRIYDENSQYPVFEGGETKYKLAKVSDSYLPLYGTITNLNTGKSTDIAASKNGRTNVLNEPGEYIVVLNNNPSFKTDSPSGDNKEITFHFNIIAHGTAPGPQVNKKSLENAMNESVSGTYPKYYGLTYTSASAGNITLAFSTREAARQYAYNYEKGTVEKQSDGTYRYTGSFMVKQKDKYDSAWDLTDAINYFADQAIQELYFDVSDESTYRTLKDATLEKYKNPRTLELSSSVVIFADGQEELLTNLDALPILNLLPYAYQEPGVNRKSEIGKAAFSFVKDKYGCDSNKVTISDSTGKEITISYNKDVESQLKSAGFKTGKVRITEETVYGDKNSYDAVYFADNDNTAKVTVSCEGDKNKNVVVTQDDEGTIIEAEAFSIKSIVDVLDPYCLLLVTDTHGNTMSFCADKPINGMWSDAGVYDISVVNRIGNKYTFQVRIAEAKYATISYQGEGTEDFQSLLVKTGDKNVSLEVPTRYGYDFAGYDDEEGTVYEDVIDQISFSGSKVLSPRWRAKKINITLKDSDGNVIDTVEATFGVDTELPIPEIPDGFVFDGWMNGEELVKGNTIKLTDEGDITLVASMTQNENADAEEMQQTDTTGDDKGKPIVPIVPIVGVFLLGSGAVVAWKNKDRIGIKAKQKKANGSDIKKDGDDVNE
jgi:hypothetical protein